MSLYDIIVDYFTSPTYLKKPTIHNYTTYKHYTITQNDGTKIKILLSLGKNLIIREFYRKGFKFLFMDTNVTDVEIKDGKILYKKYRKIYTLLIYKIGNYNFLEYEIKPKWMSYVSSDIELRNLPMNKPVMVIPNKNYEMNNFFGIRK